MTEKTSRELLRESLECNARELVNVLGLRPQQSCDLKVVDSGKYLCVPGSWTDARVSVTLGSLSPGTPSLLWRFV